MPLCSPGGGQFLVRHNSLISEKSQVVQEQFLLGIFNFFLAKRFGYLWFVFFMILNTPVFGDDIYYENCKKVDIFLIGVKILGTITGGLFHDKSKK